MADYSSLYKQLYDKYNKDKKPVDFASQQQQLESIQNQQDFGTLLNALFKSQALAGSVGGKPTKETGVDFTDFSKNRLEGLKNQNAIEQAKQAQAAQELSTGESALANQMKAQAFGNQQAAAEQNLAKGKFDLSQAQAMAPLDIQAKKAQIERMRMDAQKTGAPSTELDKNLTQLMQVEKLTKTADMIEARDPQKAKLLRDLATSTSQKILGGSPKSTESQATSALYATRAEEANKSLKDSGYDATELKRTVTGSNYYPEYLKTEPQKLYEQAQRDFVNAVLRKESGAVISEQEFDNARKQYFPQPGDTPAVVKQKEKNRQTAIAGISAAAGEPALKKAKEFNQPAPLSSGKPKTVRQNGHTYTLNEQTGEYE